MNFKIKGTFYDHKIAERQKKDGTGTITAGDMLVELNGSYKKKDGTEVVKMDLVPMNCFGDTAKKAMLFTRGEEIEITFQLEGQEYNGKQYPRIKAVFVHHAKEMAANVPKDTQSERPPDADIPW